MVKEAPRPDELMDWMDEALSHDATEKAIVETYTLFFVPVAVKRQPGIFHFPLIDFLYSRTSSIDLFHCIAS